MRREIAGVLFVFATTGFVARQQAASPAPSSVQPAFYYNVPGVTAPELLSATSANTAPGSCRQAEGVAVFSAIIDTEGVARGIQFTRRPGKSLDDLALNTVLADRFKPGAYNGVPAAVAVLIEVDLSACKEKTKDETGKERSTLQLESTPTQTVEVVPAPPPDLRRALNNSAQIPSGIPTNRPGSTRAGVTAPVVLHSVEAEFTEAAKRAKFSGVCVVSLIINAQGMPLNVHVVKSLTPSLDEKAIEAVKQYRFKPAMKDGKIPVPVMITIEVDFQLY